MPFVMAIDQGTTSSRAILFRSDISIAASAQQEFPQHFPASGWVEHEPEDIWATTIATCRAAMDKAGATAADIAAIGITNQRETVVVWDAVSGQAIHRAIVWQDRRTAEFCTRLKADGLEPMVTAKTGLIIDPYFSGTKVAWLLDNVPGARARAERGELKFGTVDCYLLWRLTGGKVHATDATNASRTLLFNIHDGAWDDELLKLLGVPRSMLPEVKDSSAHFGDSVPELFGGSITIRGIAGDQQAATIGQACFTPGMIKSTYGTGCFALLNTGATPVKSNNKLLTTVAYQLDGKRTYALEGSIFVAGSAVQWLRDGLGVIKHASETGPLADKSDSAQSVYLVPAFVGMGAPYWNPRVRGALFGLTRNTGPAELAHAALESVCYQTFDLWAAMRADWPDADAATTVLRVDGGMTASDWTMQRLADLLDAPVDRPVIQETTALGAAYLAGLSAGVFPEPQKFADNWRLDHRFRPAMSAATRERKLAGWGRAVKGLLATDEGE
ncbi:glycerol kinase GlpK [Rhodopseudomonas palustris]|uniref:Glycerol kinase n=2 Tax=Rhodopseudomonas palustris (strain ATCC BAA-98 / CGA009) TaxID=258594 RepID=GLPK_RHOPA|nr:glycerol kinase GlpK [Rhodopseudomonas palustris]Q6N3I8.1 RecName: Full=Glycerol kinase; AltName: Full=ATP:glycerol 3-phosphotransferase; AltName: Full=Glycerokinase; Short=GK [Rhodopseudomonas palustris CGA009]OPF95152.1 glycerol kinase [Rhodopseudomonas palustris]PPQ42435.1 glycerol kinase [Rhodopseudomonas palustris]QQM05256.1 Glycerol kinase [Rhodopseudomonas palustris]RJF65508.1 glycerol kinase [Rhodopseudomonas palustris]WAB76599.1 glycerol kinase GlpK [Rhodopseudomonas palustris]